MPDIEVIQRDRVCQITLNRPEKKNALTHGMYRTMADAIVSAGHSESCHLVLIRSTGDCFCGGNDMQDFINAASNEHLADNVAFMQALMHCPLPVVAEVQGTAVGIGSTLLLHCDLVIAAKSSRFSMPFVSLGLVPEFGSSYLLQQLAGHRKASRWLMLGEVMDVCDAEQAGLVSEVVADGTLAERVEEVVARLVSQPLQSLKLTKSLMCSEREQIELHMNDELDIFIDRLNSEDAQHAFSAFLAKRGSD